eukprot:747913-Hanusia_phi.AAC.1
MPFPTSRMQGKVLGGESSNVVASQRHLASISCAPTVLAILCQDKHQGKLKGLRKPCPRTSAKKSWDANPQVTPDIATRKK